MKTNNSKTKTKAFLGAALMLLIALIFTACPQKVKPKAEEPPAPPKHAITFGVEGGSGTLKAKAYGVAETTTSPINVEEGKAVIFTAKANDGYRVKGWTLDGKPITEAGTNTEYKLKVSKPATVKVSFEAIPPTKYTVTLTQTEHGKVTASPEIPEDKQVAKDTLITFTAKADDGYKVDKWTVTPAEALQAGGADESLTAKVKITADTTVSVSFIKKTYAITFSVEGGTGGTLEAKVDGKEISSGDMVEHGKKVEFTPKEEKGYRVKKWTLDGENIGGMAYFTLGVSQAATVTVSFELRPVKGGAVFILSPNKLTIEVKAKTEDGSDITVEGCNETTLKSDKYTELQAKGTVVILKGNITELSCGGNQLTALNVQGLTALQELWCSGNQLTELNVQGLTALQTLFCEGNKLTELNVQGCAALQKLGCYSNKLNAQAMTEILNALPAREAGDYARAYLYTEETDEPEGNHKDFTQPAELKAALDGAKKRNWKLGKINESGNWEDI
ncbi:leucine-rich repeat domain-containing protein [Treponema sp. OMZ 789]|nr:MULTISPECIES: leucine-rich repeat domain-containing protein [unclassified Treponema]UTC68522.1 leucine-rich repeat domain-containing protein [Treponema sp. OMZ 789]UTC69182.1 leucine-rich repeat domain-containing protein [Treponema sp. OMZ 790]UTC71895.1 leucine-rich repeat domain-containing protein [Treponema sp. OMZ 791]